MQRLAAAFVLTIAIAGQALAGNTVSRACLTPDTRAILESAEAHFNTHFKIVSTCRPHAVIAGTHHASQHAFGRAVDLLVPRGISKRAVVQWLFAHTRGVVMTYAAMPHVHFDTGPYHKLAFGRAQKHARNAHVANLPPPEHPW